MSISSVNPKSEKSIAFFKNTKVDSCNYIAVMHGQAVAIPFNANPRGKEFVPMEKRSISHDVHKIRDHLYAGMKNKPLEAYSPDAHRSRLKKQDIQAPYKNSSTIVIGDRSSNYKRHFVTTAQNLLKPPKQRFTTNLGILSEKAKWQKHKEWT